MANSFITPQMISEEWMRVLKENSKDLFNTPSVILYDAKDGLPPPMVITNRTYEPPFVAPPPRRQAAPVVPLGAPRAYFDDE